MVKVVWSDHFLVQIDEICNYIAGDSPEYASEFVSRLITKVSTLPNFPRIGRKIPEKNNDRFRELIFGNYRIIYTVKDSQLLVILVEVGHRREVYR